MEQVCFTYVRSNIWGGYIRCITYYYTFQSDNSISKINFEIMIPIHLLGNANANVYKFRIFCLKVKRAGNIDWG